MRRKERIVFLVAFDLGSLFFLLLDSITRGNGINSTITAVLVLLLAGLMWSWGYATAVEDCSAAE